MHPYVKAHTNNLFVSKILCAIGAMAIEQSIDLYHCRVTANPVTGYIHIMAETSTRALQMDISTLALREARDPDRYIAEEVYTFLRCLTIKPQILGDDK